MVTTLLRTLCESCISPGIFFLLFTCHQRTLLGRPLCIFHKLNSFAKSMGLKLGADQEATWWEFRDIGVPKVCVYVLIICIMLIGDCRSGGWIYRFICIISCKLLLSWKNRGRFDLVPNHWWSAHYCFCFLLLLLLMGGEWSCFSPSETYSSCERLVSAHKLGSLWYYWNSPCDFFCVWMGHGTRKKILRSSCHGSLVIKLALLVETNFWSR
jgi:hypothetical protein